MVELDIIFICAFERYGNVCAQATVGTVFCKYKISTSGTNEYIGNFSRQLQENYEYGYCFLYSGFSVKICFQIYKG